MQAQIIPLTRLPRPLGIFAYLVPEELVKKIKIGQLVTIPWRQSELFGLVFGHRSIGTDTTDTKSLKALLRIVYPEPLVSELHLKFLQTLSQWYGVSIANLSQMSLLPLQKKKIKQLTINHQKIKKAAAYRLPITDYFIYKDAAEHSVILSQIISGATLILVPEIYLTDEIHQRLTLEQQKQTVIWHSQLSVKQQFERWLQIRNSERTIIIGTRGAVFLPIPSLKTIIIDYEHDENHKHWDQAPRFQVKDVAPLLAQMAGATLNLMSFSPSVDHRARLLTPAPAREKNTRLIDLRAERRAGRFGFMADEIKEAILETRGDVFIFINRLGFSTSVGCPACGYVALCERCQLPLIYHQKTNNLRCHYCRTETKIIYDCPHCRKRIVQLRGGGTEFVADGVRALFGDRLKHEITRIDSEQTEALSYTPKKRIIVGTKMSFRHVRWEKTDLIAYVGIDQQLSLPEYRAAEAVWHTVQEILFRKTGAARLYIQTFNPEHRLFQALDAPENFYRAELASRRALGYPPDQYLVRYFYGNRDARLAQAEAERVCALLKSHLTKEKKTARISQAIEMHPRFYRNQFWYTIIVRLEPKNWPEELVRLNQLIPANWKIDPNPISLLSP